ncbi:MAG: hypothetical protein LUB63_00805 [Oscillospiraceae bacterium]|nr:hypothetical protein [Oscillospiraceae bacterium]
MNGDTEGLSARIGRSALRELPYGLAGAVLLLGVPILTNWVLWSYRQVVTVGDTYVSVLYGGLFFLPAAAGAILALCYALRHGKLCVSLLAEGVLWQIPVWFGAWGGAWGLVRGEGIWVKEGCFGDFERYCLPLLGAIVLLGLLGAWAGEDRERKRFVWLGFWSAGLLLTAQTALLLVTQTQPLPAWALAPLPLFLLLWELLRRRGAAPVGFRVLAALLVLSVLLSQFGCFRFHRPANLLFVLSGFAIAFAGECLAARRTGATG